MPTRSLIAYIVIAFALVTPRMIHSQTTAFSYQGSFEQNGTPANGGFDFEFRLFDALTNGVQVGSTLTQLSIAVNNGTFAVTLDFGGGAFSGSGRFLEIGIRPSGGGAYTILAPRSQILSTPYAIRSVSADSSATAANASQLGGISPSGYIQNTTSQQASSNLNISGNGLFGGNVGIGTTSPQAKLDVSGRALVNGTTSAAVLTVTNSQPGITDPSPVKFPPVGVRGETTSTSETTVGVVGISSGSKGIGIVGITNGDGSGTGESDATGVLTIATAATGDTIGLSAEVASAKGTAIVARTSATGTIFKGESDNNSTPNPKFIVTAIGQVRANASVFAKGFNLNSGNFGVSENGTVSAFTLETVSNLNVGGTLGGSTDTLQVANNINIPGNITSVGTITPGMPGGGDLTVCRLSGSNTLRFCSLSLRYKENVQSFKGGLDIIQKLKPISFDWKENGSHDVGLSAEEVAKIEPLLTFNNPNGEIEGVKYSQLNIVLINAVKEQQRQIERQQTQISSLTNRLDKLQRKPVRRGAR